MALIDSVIVFVVSLLVGALGIYGQERARVLGDTLQAIQQGSGAPRGGGMQSGGPNPTHPVTRRYVPEVPGRRRTGQQAHRQFRDRSPSRQE